MLFTDKNKTMIYISEALELFREELGQNFTIAYIFQCGNGTYFDIMSCLCDWPTNAVNGFPYPELYMVVAYGPSYQIVPYPFSFHPSDIEPDPGYPNQPINSSTINNTPSCDVTATLDAINPTVTPGQKIDLTATISIGNGVVIEDKHFEVYYGGSWLENSIRSDPAINQDTVYAVNGAEINVLGALKYRLRIEYSCNGVSASPIYSNEVSTYSQYTSTQFMAQFASQMDDAWSQTKASTIANQGTKYEYAFAVYYNAANREIKLDGGINNASVPCGTPKMGVNTPEYSLPSVINPFYGTNFTVGNFHTHPPLTYCSSNESIVPGPSTDDKALTPKYPRIVRTYKNTVQGGHNINLPTEDYITNSKTVTDY